jgi:hypothetical protein
MRIVLAISILAACNVTATRFTPLGDGGGVTAGGDATGDGQVLAPAMLTASPTAAIGLGTIVIGQTSGATAITVSNDGDLDSGPIAVRLDDTSLGFVVGNDSCKGLPLAGHRTCMFDVTFTPTTNAAAQTNLRVAASPGGEVIRVISGSGLVQGQINITDTSFTFPNHGLGAAAATKVFTIANGGQSPVGRPMPSVTGTGGYAVQSTTCSAALNQTDTCTITVAFAPIAVGTQSGSLVVTSTPGGQDSAQLSGTAFAHVVVSATGTGGGSIMSTQQPGISCPGTCAADFTSTPVTLNAVANGTSTFAGWGSDCGGSGACTLNLVAPKSVTASFSVNNYPLTVGFTSSHSAPITISSSPPGINCDGSSGCTANFPYNTPVALTANPDPSSALVSWSSGPCAGTTTPTCMFNMPGLATSTIAAFDWFGTMTILMNMGDPMLGFPTATTRVNSNDGTIDCTNTTSLAGTCTTHIVRDQTMTLTYRGNPLTEWTACKGGTEVLHLVAHGSGDCQPQSGIICSNTSCPSLRTCQVTFAQPGAYISEYDVYCVQ